jgi:hypothetical protein
MRPTLEQLQAMSDASLFVHWLEGRFPFEAAECGRCITQHLVSPCGGHALYQREASALTGDFYDQDRNKSVEEKGAFLRGHLEEFIALRLFYDPLYRQDVQQETPAEQLAVA